MLDYLGQSFFALPAFLGDAEELESLLSDPNNIDEINTRSHKDCNRTALHKACFGLSNLECVTLLVKSGADPLAFDGMGRIPLHFAANAARIEILTYLFSLPGEVFPADLLVTDIHGRTIVHAICSAGYSANAKATGSELVESILFLLSSVGEPLDALYQQDAYGLTPLMLAKYYKLQDILDSLAIVYGIDIAAIAEIPPDHPGIAQDYYGNTSIKDHPMIPNVQAAHRNKLHLACSNYSNDIEIHALLEYPGMIPMAVDIDGSTALHFAAATCNAPALCILLISDNVVGNINAIDNEGRTALHALAMCDPSMAIAELVDLLIIAGANPYLVDDDGLTAAELAIERDNDLIAERINDYIMQTRLGALVPSFSAISFAESGRGFFAGVQGSAEDPDTQEDEPVSPRSASVPLVDSGTEVQAMPNGNRQRPPRPSSVISV